MTHNIIDLNNLSIENIRIDKLNKTNNNIFTSFDLDIIALASELCPLINYNIAYL